MEEKNLDKILDMAEDFFKTESDSKQILIGKESFYKLQRLHPKTVVCKLENGELISWVVILPTQVELMEKFLNDEINERELLDMTEVQEKYEALYLCAAFTVHKYRRKGYALQMFKEAIDAISKTENVKLFTWLFSEEGGKIIEKLNQILGTKILVKN